MAATLEGIQATTGYVANNICRSIYWRTYPISSPDGLEGVVKKFDGHFPEFPAHEGGENHSCNISDRGSSTIRVVCVRELRCRKKGKDTVGEPKDFDLYCPKKKFLSGAICLVLFR
jgi:hypothetical protein